MIGLPSARPIRRPALRVDPARPLQEIDEVVELLVGQMELRHLAPTGHAARLRLHPADEGGPRALLVLVAAVARPDVAELRGEIGALAEQRMAIDAGVALPD